MSESYTVDQTALIVAAAGAARIRQITDLSDMPFTWEQVEALGGEFGLTPAEMSAAKILPMPPSYGRKRLVAGVKQFNRWLWDLPGWHVVGRWLAYAVWAGWPWAFFPLVADGPLRMLAALFYLYSMFALIAWWVTLEDPNESRAKTRAVRRESMKTGRHNAKAERRQRVWDERRLADRMREAACQP